MLGTTHDLEALTDDFFAAIARGDWNDVEVRAAASALAP